ncbi:MAG: hypothetical protein FD156_1451 [Nitrospirae bacterium]|nr:MAG: hypothetical protein FD156_1451 [Nitrospirota bacterium]
MLKKSLKKTNPYLKDPSLSKALLYQSVSSSTAVEGVITKYPKLSKSMEKKLKEVISVNESSASYESQK